MKITSQSHYENGFDFEDLQEFEDQRGTALQQLFPKKTVQDRFFQYMVKEEKKKTIY